MCKLSFSYFILLIINIFGCVSFEFKSCLPLALATQSVPSSHSVEFLINVIFTCFSFGAGENLSQISLHMLVGIETYKFDIIIIKNSIMLYLYIYIHHPHQKLAIFVHNNHPERILDLYINCDERKL